MQKSKRRLATSLLSMVTFIFMNWLHPVVYIKFMAGAMAVISIISMVPYLQAAIPLIAKVILSFCSGLFVARFAK